MNRKGGEGVLAPESSVLGRVIGESLTEKIISERGQGVEGRNSRQRGQPVPGAEPGACPMFHKQQRDWCGQSSSIAVCVHVRAKYRSSALILPLRAPSTEHCMEQMPSETAVG